MFAATCKPNSEELSNKMRVKFTESLKEYKGGKLPDSNVLTQIEEVDSIIKSLKLGKAIGADHLSAEHLKYAHPIVYSICSST